MEKAYPERETWSDAEQAQFLKNELSEVRAALWGLIGEVEAGKNGCRLCAGPTAPFEETLHAEDCYLLGWKKMLVEQKAKLRERKLGA